METSLFQPGLIFYEAIVGSFKASGVSFHQWCKENDVNYAAACQALKGQSKGPRGVALADRLIDAAGRDVVSAAYRARIERHAAEVAA